MLKAMNVLLASACSSTLTVRLVSCPTSLLCHSNILAVQHCPARKSKWSRAVLFCFDRILNTSPFLSLVHLMKCFCHVGYSSSHMENSA